MPIIITSVLAPLDGEPPLAAARPALMNTLTGWRFDATDGFAGRLTASSDDGDIAVWAEWSDSPSGVDYGYRGRFESLPLALQQALSDFLMEGQARVRAAAPDLENVWARIVDAWEDMVDYEDFAELPIDIPGLKYPLVEARLRVPGPTAYPPEVEPLFYRNRRRSIDENRTASLFEVYAPHGGIIAWVRQLGTHGHPVLLDLVDEDPKIGLTGARLTEALIARGVHEFDREELRYRFETAAYRALLFGDVS
ncbi:hypothetical protein GCM10025867_49860 (plasmid) [Frondihabitans sucicola]|uniref:Uncharacterized protein n=1 Tax=Frondihabitans sucicola TaxID=1268041 RepID=A0ABN6Y9W8_9MICO|nr:hypothetical protein [Frondihabitans sucicola]BDZ52745.1 hypothetical protein GCM10025867_49860 [Frondihabitans sucicola]